MRRATTSSSNADPRLERLRESLTIPAELVRLNVDVIVAEGTVSALAAKKVTNPPLPSHALDLRELEVAARSLKVRRQVVEARVWATLLVQANRCLASVRRIRYDPRCD